MTTYKYHVVVRNPRCTDYHIAAFSTYAAAVVEAWRILAGDPLAPLLVRGDELVIRHGGLTVFGPKGA